MYLTGHCIYILQLTFHNNDLKDVYSTGYCIYYNN